MTKVALCQNAQKLRVLSRRQKAALAALRGAAASGWPLPCPAFGRALEIPCSAPAPMTVTGNSGGSCPLTMSLTTADIGIQLLMDSTVNLQEIEARITARVFGPCTTRSTALLCERCWSSCWRCWMTPARMA